MRFRLGATFGDSVPFQDQPILNGNYVVGCEAMDDNILQFTPDRTPVTASSASFSVTWFDGSDQRHQDVPVNTLSSSYNAGVYKEYVPFQCDFQKSRVKYMGQGGIGQAQSVPFVIYYMRPEDLVAYEKLMVKLERG